MTKKISLVLTMIILTSASAFAKIEKVSFIKNGAYVQKIGAYVLGDVLYLDAKEMAKIMKGKIYWYPVSGRLFFQVKGKKVVFNKGDDKIIINGKKAEFSRPYIVRGGRPFILKDFLVSKVFSSAFGFKLTYDSGNRVLEEKHNINVNSVNYFSYKDRTRIVIYMSENLDYDITTRENNFISVRVPGAMAYGNEKISINDGVVKDMELIQENKYLRIGISLSENFREYKAFKLSSPYRIVLDFCSVYSNVTKEAAESIAPTSAVIKEKPAALETGEGAVITSFPKGSSDNELPAEEEKIDLNIPDKIIVKKGGVKRIIIDPGHGGKDPGGKKLFGLKEKDINLRVAKLLYKKLKKVKGFEVKMTRTSDVFVPLHKRSEIANKWKADIFISLHANASRSRKEHGFEIYFMSENASDPWAAEVADFENSVLKYEKEQKRVNQAAILLHSLARNEYMNEGAKLAGFVAKECARRTPFRSRGVKQAAFYVLRGTYAPGILVEMGFMTNRRDQANLNSWKIRRKIADAIYRGVLNYAKAKGWK